MTTPNPQLLAIRNRKAKCRKILRETISELLASPNAPEPIEMAILLIQLSNELLRDESYELQRD